MTLDSKRVWIGVLSGSVMTLSAGLFLLHALLLLLLHGSISLDLHYPLYFLLSLTPLLPFCGGIWCARIAVYRPEFWGRRTLAGALLLFLPFLCVSLFSSPRLIVGLLGMPRRIDRSPLAFAELAAFPVALLMSAITGVWLIRAKRR